MQARLERYDDHYHDFQCERNPSGKTQRHREWAGRNTPDVWCMQEVRAPQNEIDPIFDEFGFEYSTAGLFPIRANCIV